VSNAVSREWCPRTGDAASHRHVRSRPTWPWRPRTGHEISPSRISGVRRGSQRCPRLLGPGRPVHRQPRAGQRG